jgi:hypothetical protein
MVKGLVNIFIQFSSLFDFSTMAVDQALLIRQLEITILLGDSQAHRDTRGARCQRRHPRLTESLCFSEEESVSNSAVHFVKYFEFI